MDDFYNDKSQNCDSEDDIWLSLTKNRSTINCNLLNIDPNPFESQKSVQYQDILNIQSPPFFLKSSNSAQDRSEKNYSLNQFQSAKEEPPSEEKKPRTRSHKKVLDKEIVSSFKQLDKKEIFREKQICKQKKKNTNIPKFFVRLFLKHFEKEKSREDVGQKLQHLLQELKNRKYNNYSMQDVMNILFNFDEGRMGWQNRKMMRKILKGHLKKEVILNNYIQKSRMTYMMVSKVYSLRCCSRELVKRLQFR